MLQAVLVNYRRPGTPAQNGTYLRSFGGACWSNGLITPAATASRMYRDTIALLFVLMPNRSRSEALVRKSRVTYYRHACR